MAKKRNKIFTLQEAEALLPELEKRLKLLRTKKEAYSRTHDLLFMQELVCAAEKSRVHFRNFSVILLIAMIEEIRMMNHVSSSASNMFVLAI